MKSWRLLPVLTLLALLAGCASTQPQLQPKPLAHRPDCTGSTPAAALAAQLSQSPHSGVQLLDTGVAALAARAALIEAASCAIDMQYYIWNSDASGRYLAGRLLAAADRGVHVRLLLDDINVGGREGVLAVMAAHPNVEIQVYNPFAERRGLLKTWDFLSDFARLNRRMHIKSFTVDQAFSIVGGRNIGDEYFDTGEHLNFRDRDLLVSGPVVGEVSTMFSRFWHSPLARPLDGLTKGASPPETNQISQNMATARQRIIALHGPLPQHPTAALQQLKAAGEQMTWAPVSLIHDPPPDPTSLAETDHPQAGAAALREIAQGAHSEILIESAYLVLDDGSLEEVVRLRERGVHISALTNSLASNDVTANHAAYARRRVQMLASGMELHELRPDAPSCQTLVRNNEACGPEHVFGLHAKTYVLDRRLVYVGSLNLNLRSRYLNAEAGLLIESPALASRIADDIETNMQPSHSWEPALADDGSLYWTGNSSLGQTERHDHDPEVSWLRRLKSGFISLLPLEKYL